MGIQREKGLCHLGGLVDIIVPMAPHLALAVATHTMWINGHKLGLERTQKEMYKRAFSMTRILLKDQFL